MTETEDIRKKFADKLDAQRQAQEERLALDLKSLRSGLSGDLGRQAQQAAERLAARPAPALVQPQVDLTGSTALADLDRAFARLFNLGAFYPVERLNYPTVYCESLEEFFTPWVNTFDLSLPAKQEQMGLMVAKAKEDAAEHGGGMLGYNLPGIGAYINGWIFAYGQDFSPKEAFQNGAAHRRIMETAIHEKLGHGFIVAYSALGQVKNRLGLTMADLGAQFGLRPADDPVSSLRAEQAGLIFTASQLLEEGWATWIETSLGVALLKAGNHPRADLDKVVEVFKKLPANLPQRQEIQQALLGSVVLLFGEEQAPLEYLHRAVMVVEDLGSQLNEYFSHALHQPLRYVLGELLLYQAEVNLGAQCVPYATLVAGSVTFDPAQVGLADLRDLLSRDPRLHPDARIAAISRLKVEQKDDVRGMAKAAAAQLSFSIPKELQG